MPDSNSIDRGLKENFQHVRDELAAEFSNIFAPETVAEFVDQSVALFNSPDVEHFLPQLVHRYARDLLRSIARTRGFLPKTRPEVLFVCIHNAGRSQMAAALLTHLSKNHPVTVRCAGTQPACSLHPGVAEVMAEIGVQMVEAFPKPLHRELLEAADVIITMGCGDACPLRHGPVYEDWCLPDPMGMSLDQLRELRDDINGRVQGLIERLRAMGSLVVW